MTNQAGIYNQLVAPYSKAVLMDASNFFDEFLDLYDDAETLNENLDVLVESTGEIVKGFEISTSMHKPVTKQA